MIREKKKTRVKRKDQEYVEWSSPKKLLKIVNTLKNENKELLKKKYIKNTSDSQNLMNEYKNIFLGFDYQILFNCGTEGTYFTQQANFQINCEKTDKFIIYVLEKYQKRRKILIKLDMFFP